MATKQEVFGKGGKQQVQGFVSLKQAAELLKMGPETVKNGGRFSVEIKRGESTTANFGANSVVIASALDKAGENVNKEIVQLINSNAGLKNDLKKLDWTVEKVPMQTVRQLIRNAIGSILVGVGITGYVQKGSADAVINTVLICLGVGVVLDAIRSFRHNKKAKSVKPRLQEFAAKVNDVLKVAAESVSSAF